MRKLCTGERTRRWYGTELFACGFSRGVVQPVDHEKIAKITVIIIRIFSGSMHGASVRLCTGLNRDGPQGSPLATISATVLARRAFVEALCLLPVAFLSL